MLLSAALVFLLLGVTAARAATVYTPIGSFGSAGSEDGRLTSPQRVAVDPLTGDIFVADTGNDRVQVFSPSAAPGSCGEVCATYLTQFGSAALTDEPIGVAVDPATGDVYVMAAGATNAVVKFSPDSRSAPTSYSQVPAAEFTSPAQGSGTGEIGSFGQLTGFGVAMGAIFVDPTGVHDLLVADPGNGRIERFDPEGAFIGAFNGSENAGGDPSGEPAALLVKPVDLAVDSAGDIYVADLDESANSGEGGLRFLRFDGEGLYEAELASPRQSNPDLSAAVLGVEPDAGEVFLSSFFIFSPSQIYRVAAANQEIEHFRCPGSVCESPLLGIAGSPALGALTGRLYVVASTAFGGGTPAVQVFEAVELPGVSIEAPGDITGVAASFHGTVDPNGSDAQWHFEYRPVGTSAWSNVPGPDGDAGSGPSPVEVEATASGLEANTEYEVRLVASKGGSNTTSATLTFSTSSAAATVVTGGTFSTTGSSATLAGTVDLLNSPVADCHFEYGTTAAYGRSAPCSPGNAQIDDRDEVQQIRVPASAAEKFELGFEGDFTGALAGGEPAGAVQTALDDLATIGGVGGSVSVGGGPEGLASSPYAVTFEGSLTRKDVQQLVVREITSIPIDERVVETTNPGGSPVQVSADIGGLQPDTAFHFRLVADNGVGGPQAGSDSAFTTRAEAETDHPVRHYELVSAADTNGIEATPDVAAADGDAYAYATLLPSPPTPVSGKPSLYVATRNPDGSWSQRPANVPTPTRVGARDVSTSGEIFSGDLSEAAVSVGGDFDPDDQNGSTDSYLKQIPSGQVRWLSRDPSIVGPQTEGGAAEPIYISPDGGTVIFGSYRDLLPADDSGPNALGLYQWRDGTLSLLSLIPGSGGSCVGGACVAADAGSVLGSNLDPLRGTSYGAVSADGSRVVFESGSSAARLYIRLDGERTVEADTSAPGAPPLAGAPIDVTFQGADEEDESVFFSSSSPLTPDSSAPDAPRGNGSFRTSPSHADLYVYEVGSSSLRNLTPSAGGAGVERVYDVSTDGRRLYFTDRKRLDQDGDLTETALPGEELKGAPGSPNLYLAELDGSRVRLRFIATIDPFEDEAAVPGLFTEQAFREAAASPDGSLLAFRDSLDPVPGRRTGGFSQVFVYDAGRDELSCASCPSDGRAATGTAYAAFHSAFTANPLGAHFRAVSDAGSVFFESPTALLGADTDGTGDVYEWRSGSLALISAGTGGRASQAAGASRDGSTVFFASADSLLPGAQGGITHIYAARTGPAPEALTLPPPCSGEDCRGAAPGAPEASSAGSTAVGGPGNHRLGRRCPRGKRSVRHRGTVRCRAKHRPRNEDKDERHRQHRRGAGAKERAPR